MQTIPDPELSSVPDVWYVLVCRLPLAGEGDFSLGASLMLRRLQKPLSISDLAALGAVGFRDWAALEPFAAAATAEIVAPTTAADTPSFDALRRCWLVSALLVIRGFALHVCPACSAYPWSRIAGHRAHPSAALASGAAGETGKVGLRPRESLPKFQGHLLDCHPRLLVPREAGATPFDAREASWFAENFERFDRLSSNDDRFRLALEAAVDWRYAKDPRAAISRLWEGLGSLVGTDPELVYRASQRVAAIIAPRGPGRLAAFKKMKTLHGLRSEAAQSGHAKSSDLLAGLHDSFEALRALLLDVVERGAVRTEADFHQELQS